MQIQEDLPVNRKGHDKIKDLRKYWDELIIRHRRLDDEIKQDGKHNEICWSNLTIPFYKFSKFNITNRHS